MLITINNISKSFSDNLLFKDANFCIDDNEKIGIVGINGSGKTTLMKMLIGQEDYEVGDINIKNNLNIGYISQIQNYDENISIYDEMVNANSYIIDLQEKMNVLNQKMLEAKGEYLNKLISEYSTISAEFEKEEGFLYFSNVKGILKGLGFNENEWDKKAVNLSGGESRRLELGKILLLKPDILFLDEPTNHLDLQSIEWLETYLKDYKKSVVLISHDRYFIDEIVNKILEIDNFSINTYNGNYSQYAKKRFLIRQNMIKAYENQQKELKHQEEVIDKLKSFNREKSVKRARSRQKQMDKIEKIEKIKENDIMKLSFQINKISSNRVLTVENLGKSFDKKSIFENVNFEIRRGEKVALIGRNGTGKTTILKIINGIINEYEGKLTFGENLSIAYFEQNFENMNEQNTIFDEIATAYPKLNNTKIRNALAAFLFTKDDVFKVISTLSGGEKGRVALLKLMLSGANFLIMDEPTNHLDINSKEILEDALQMYDGTILYVSHDRFFINKTADRILELTYNKVKNYIGNYDYYIEKSQNSQITTEKAMVDKKESENINSNDNLTKWKNSKKRQADIKKLKNNISSIEKEINICEDRIKSIEEELQIDEVATNHEKCNALSIEHKILQDKLLILYEDWEQNIENLNVTNR